MTARELLDPINTARELLDTVNTAIKYVPQEELANELDIEIRLFVATKLYLSGHNYRAYQATLNR